MTSHILNTINTKVSFVGMLRSPSFNIHLFTFSIHGREKMIETNSHAHRDTLRYLIISIKWTTIKEERKSKKRVFKKWRVLSLFRASLFLYFIANIKHLSNSQYYIHINFKYQKHTLHKHNTLSLSI